MAFFILNNDYCTEYLFAIPHNFERIKISIYSVTIQKKEF